MTQKMNDNDVEPADAGQSHPDAHGQAAMLLVESLIHGLVSREVISVGDAIEIVDTAAEAKAEMAVDVGLPPESLRRSLTLFDSISASLSHDLNAATT